MGLDGRFYRSALDYRYTRSRQICQGRPETVVHFPLDGSGCFWHQSGNLPSYRIDNSLYTFPRFRIGIVHFFIALKVDRYKAFAALCHWEIRCTDCSIGDGWN